MKIAFDNGVIGDTAVSFSRDIATVSDAGVEPAAKCRKHRHRRHSSGLAHL